MLLCIIAHDLTTSSTTPSLPQVGMDELEEQTIQTWRGNPKLLSIFDVNLLFKNFKMLYGTSFQIALQLL